MLTPDPSFLDAYCERSGNPAFFAEPLNALTNLGFLVAAGLALLTIRKLGTRDRLTSALILLAALIGIGSFLFHTIPNRVTVLLDVLPIQAFILTYVALATRRYLGASLLWSGVAPVLFMAASTLFVSLVGSRAMGGSIAYVPALVALVGFALAIRYRDDPATRPAALMLLAAAAVFTVSLTFRTLDRPLCGSIPAGLHFLWHLLNATVLWILLLAAIRYGILYHIRSTR
jgi:hypothetical protein